MKWVITGGRDITDKTLIESHLNDMMSKYGKPTEFIHGDCCGVDKIGGQWAEANNIPVKKFPANWSKHGKAAGPMRNREMAEYCLKEDLCIGIWDGKSKGTKDMLTVCEKKGINREIKMVTKKRSKNE